MTDMLGVVLLNGQNRYIMVCATLFKVLDVAGENNTKLFSAIVRGSSFKVNCEETLSSDFIFVRSRNSEFNYSENPSFIKGATGEVYWDSYINAPQTYVTTIGLYYDNIKISSSSIIFNPQNGIVSSDE